MKIVLKLDLTDIKIIINYFYEDINDETKVLSIYPVESINENNIFLAVCSNDKCYIITKSELLHVINENYKHINCIYDYKDLEIINSKSLMLVI